MYIQPMATSTAKVGAGFAVVDAVPVVPYTGQPAHEDARRVLGIAVDEQVNIALPSCLCAFA